MSRTPDGARHRSARAEIRNPALGLPAVRALRSLCPDLRLLLAVLLHDLRRDARARADSCWKSRKAFLAAYWSVVSVYSGHFARALTNDLGARRSTAPFLVRQEGFPDISARDWAEASRLYGERRDRLGLGARCYPSAAVLIGCIPIGRISYNGRIWPLEAWAADQKPIYDNQTL